MTYLPCHRCRQQNGITIRGLCGRCAPGLHETYRVAGDAMSRLSAEFERETGKTALGAWSEFEEFMSKHIAPDELSAFKELMD